MITKCSPCIVVNWLAEQSFISSLQLRQVPWGSATPGAKIFLIWTKAKVQKPEKKLYIYQHLLSAIYMLESRLIWRNYRDIIIWQLQYTHWLIKEHNLSYKLPNNTNRLQKNTIPKMNWCFLRKRTLTCHES